MVSKYMTDEQMRLIIAALLMCGTTFSLEQFREVMWFLGLSGSDLIRQGFMENVPGSKEEYKTITPAGLKFLEGDDL